MGNQQKQNQKSSIDFLAKIEEINKTNNSFIYSPQNCIRCGRCAIKCQQIQGLSPLQFDLNSHKWLVCPTISHDENREFCVYCGQCLLVCPTGAISHKSQIEQVRQEIANPNKIVIAQTAPSIRVSIGEMQNMPIGTLLTGRLVCALRKLGFDKVFDTNFGADLTTIEEANELLERLEQNKNLPLISSCCPSWILFMEKYFFDLKDNVSSCKSPHEMLGSIIKTYYAQLHKLDPKNIVVVSIMPCTSKKFEIKREELKVNGFYPVDYVLTTYELGLMLNEAKIELRKLEDDFYDPILGWSSGAANLYGTSGGVCESVLRYLVAKLNLKDQNIEFEQVRGEEGIRQAEVNLGQRTIKVMIIYGLKNAKAVLEKVRKKELDVDFIEIMACPFGCIGGGGQNKLQNPQLIKNRALGLYYQDKLLPARNPADNQEIKNLYQNFLISPLSQKSKELLHTTYKKRE